MNNYSNSLSANLPPGPPLLGGFDQALTLLEFDQIRQRLAGYTRTNLGQEYAQNLTSTADGLEIANRQQETTEARRFLDGGGGLEFGPGGDLRGYAQRAMLGGMLRGEELHEIRRLAGASGYNRHSLRRREDLPLLTGLTQNLPDLGDLEQAIRSAISPAGEALDDASPNLRQLRRDSRAAYQQLNEAMQRSLRRYQRRSIVQEPIIAQRNGRLVLLIKAEFKSQAPGIIHDVSDSGATVFVEPLPAIEAGNRWREARLAEEREEERILRSLSAAVGAAGPELLLALDLLARLDLAIAKGRCSADQRAIAPVIETPTTGAPLSASTLSPDLRLRLNRARHPLLADKVVPISLELGGDHRAMVITGPNAGGKTVALKTVGLLALMAHAGLHVPAEFAQFPLLDGIYTDIGDQQSIEQSLSTFSSHIKNLRSILEQITPHSLILIDELGASTDPEEGSALAQAILGYFRQRKVLAIATTHHRGVARYAQEQPGMINASVDLDPGSLEPTYRITLGLPGRSYALTIADRLGLAPEIVESARSMVSPSLRAADDLIQELQAERNVVAQLRQEAEGLADQARSQQAQVEAQLASVEDTRLNLVEEARQDLQNRIGGLLAQLQQAERALQLAETARTYRHPAPPPSTSQRGQPPYDPSGKGKGNEPTLPGQPLGQPLGRPLGDGPAEPLPEPNDAQFTGQSVSQAAAQLREQQARLTEAQREISASQWQPIEVKRTPWQERLQSGDRVYIRGIPRPVEVIAPQDAEGQIEALLGSMRAKIPVYQLERPAETGFGVETSAGGTVSPSANPGGRAKAGSGSANYTGAGGSDESSASSGPRFRHNRDVGVYYRRPSPRQIPEELDLRGRRVEAALDLVENHLNQAALSGMVQLRLIHGHGAGALRRAIREYLQGHPLIAAAGPPEGVNSANDGVTLVELK